jgi:hypothetical protein
MNISFDQIDEIVLEDVHPEDFPDFCDAHATSCEINGRGATDEELGYINETFRSEIQELAMEHCISCSDFYS